MPASGSPASGAAAGAAAGGADAPSARGAPVQRQGLGRRRRGEAARARELPGALRERVQGSGPRAEQEPALIFEGRGVHLSQPLEQADRLGRAADAGRERDLLLGREAARDGGRVLAGQREPVEPGSREVTVRGLAGLELRPRSHGDDRDEARRVGGRERELALVAGAARERRVRRGLRLRASGRDEAHARGRDTREIEREEPQHRRRLARARDHLDLVPSRRRPQERARGRAQLLAPAGEPRDEEDARLERAKALVGDHERGQREQGDVRALRVGAAAREASLDGLEGPLGGELEPRRRTGVAREGHAGRDQLPPERRDPERAVGRGGRGLGGRVRRGDLGVGARVRGRGLRLRLGDGDGRVVLGAPPRDDEEHEPQGHDGDDEEREVAPHGHRAPASGAAPEPAGEAGGDAEPAGPGSPFHPASSGNTGATPPRK